jgi:replicative DNA helicase
MGDMISPESFYVEKHRIIYREMMDLARTNDPIDIVTVTTKLREKNLFDTVGGGSYLAEITGLVPSATNLDYYAGIVTKKSILRSLITAGDEIVEHAFNESEDVEHVLDTAEKRIMGITNRGTSAKKFTGIREILPSTWDLLMKLKDNTGELRGVPTGFRDMDKKLNGFQSSDLIILAARPSMGKTSLALDLARHAALDHNIPVGIFSLEMSAQSLVDRMLSAEARVDAWKMRDGHLKEKEKFFNVAKFKDAVFEASIIEKNTAEMPVYAYIAKGKLTLKGVTKDVELKFNYSGAAEQSYFDKDGKEIKVLVAGFEGETVINRAEYGIDGGGAGEEIKIEVNLEAAQEKK